MLHLKSVLDPYACAASGDSFFKNLVKAKDGEWLSWKHEKHQGISEYIASRPNKPTASSNTIYFQPLTDGGTAAMPDLDFLQKFTHAWFGLEVVVQHPMSLSKLLKVGFKNSFRSSGEGMSI